MSRISKTHRLDHHIGSFVDGQDELVIRLWADDHKDGGGIYWVDWEVIEVAGEEHVSGGVPQVRYQRRGATNGLDWTDILDDAEPVAEGMTKWDGCTQFTTDIHVDSRHHLDSIFGAIQEARRLAASLMPDKLVAEDYPEGAE